jgi:tRNA A-37 threonylcarbamoyl transferase component Bud32
MRAPEFRLRAPTPGVLALPWDRPLSEWNVPDVPLRDIAVGPSRHLVKFVDADDQLWAVKDMPPRIAIKEYDVLRRLEEMGLPAVRPAGLVLQPEFDTAILVTRYLEGSWQYRRLFMRLPPDQPKHRARLFDAMAGLLVELHRHGVFWGDCSLANTLFSRDGQLLQAWLVDAETSEVHPSLSRGQRQHDLDILVENVALGMLDLAERLGRPSADARSMDIEELNDTLVREAENIRNRYDTLWDVLHAKPVFGFSDRYRVEGTIRRLNELGFAVDELSLQPDTADPSQLKLHVAVGDRRYHAQHLRELTGLDVGEGQAGILLGDLRAYQAQLCREVGHDVDEPTAARLWVIEVLTPYEQLAHEAVHRTGTPIQAYCDLLEVRWLLSEKTGHDVGTNRALAALARDVIPADSAAKMAIAEVPTAPFAVLEVDDD